MNKRLWWKMPFLIVIGFTGWVTIFPDQFHQLMLNLIDISEIHAQQARDTLARERTSRIVDRQTIVTSVCDHRLLKYGSHRLIPHVGGCTEMQCPSDRPCCNSCLIIWSIENTEFQIEFSRNPPANCQATHCGLSGCPENGFLLSDLQRDKCFMAK